MADSDAEISGGEDCLNDDNPTEDLEVEDANSYELNLGPGFTPRKVVLILRCGCRTILIKFIIAFTSCLCFCFKAFLNHNFIVNIILF